VALSASALPTGVTALFDPGLAPGSTSSLVLTASVIATLGTFPVLVTATGTGASAQSATLSLTVQASSSGTTVSASFCPATGVPIWVAFQDGTGSWVRANAVGGVYSAQITSGRGGIAYVTTNAAGAVTTTVRYGTVAELRDFNDVFCYGTAGTGKTVSVSLVGASTNYVMMGLGSAVAVAPAGIATPFQNVPDGTLDLIASRSTPAGTGLTVNRLFAQRAVTQAAGSTVTIDFSGPFAVDPVTSTLTIAGLGADPASFSSIYRTANSTLVLYAFDAASTSPTRTFAGFPTFGGSFHQAMVTATGTGGSRTAGLVFATVAPRTVTLGPELGAVTVTSAATTPTLRPQAVVPAAAPYHQSWSFVASQGTGAQARTTIVQTTTGYVGTTPTVTLVVPDLSAATGWLVDWGLRVGISTSWSASGQSTAGFGPQGTYAEGATSFIGMRSGTLSPEQ
jgi:hypothetical protein